jgi:adenylate cyclase
MSTDRTFVFADLAGYTALTEAHGDDDAAQIATRFHELARACLPAGTRLVKTIGDAVMLVAPTIEDGIRAALAIARSVAAQPAFPALRVGLHAGPVVERDDDFFGATVNIAARVSGVAYAGEIVCTERIASIATGEGLAAARPMGTVRLKNVAAPVTLYELNVGDTSSELRHIDPVCRMQVVPDEAPARTAHEGTMLYFCSLGCAAKFGEAPEVHLPLASERPAS